MLKEIGYLAVVLIMNLKYSNEVSRRKANWIPKIIGGSPVSIKRFPSMVQLYNLGDMCAGNIINSWSVLTAAHCFDFNKNVEDVVVQAGSRYVYDFNADSYGVVLIDIHEKYNQTQIFACDIALVFVDRKFKFSDTTRKAVLVDNTRWMNRRETNFTATGWGWTSYGGELSKQGLMMAHLRFIPNDKCERMHKISFSEDMFCLYGEGSRDTCKGDSGGGVVWHGTPTFHPFTRDIFRASAVLDARVPHPFEHWWSNVGVLPTQISMIVGLTSHGDGCAQKKKPSVYANVYYFRSWIKDKETEFINNFCQITQQNFNNINRVGSLELML